MSSVQQVNTLPPHISQLPPSYPETPLVQQQQQQQWQQQQQSPPAAMFTDPNLQALQAQQRVLIGQNYRDQLFAQCAIGNHERKTEYGICGIITAIVCFPIGLICLFIDTKDKCSRCGVSLEKK